MKKITRLTSEQEAKLPEYRDKWLKIGLSTEPLDFENAKIAVNKCYKIAELKKPKYYFRFQSPYSAAVGGYLIKNIFTEEREVWAPVRDQVWDQVWDQVEDQVRDQVWAQVRDQVWDQVWDQVRAPVWAQVWAQVRAQVRDQVEDQVRDQVRAQVEEQVRAQVYGCHDANWLGFYEFFRNELKLKGCDKLIGLIDLAKYCGWWAPYKNIVILQDRPKTIIFDNQNRLHCETGPAIKYRDNFAVYSWHGTRIPKEWIEGKLTAKMALEVDNLERRRIACEIVGWSNILEQLKAKSIDKDKNPQIGELLEVNLPDVGREKFLKVECGTGRIFCIPVDPQCMTALEANSWTYGLEPKKYQPEVRT